MVEDLTIIGRVTDPDEYDGLFLSPLACVDGGQWWVHITTVVS
jgi:hypothetical protein